jgi:hypothetical protein
MMAPSMTRHPPPSPVPLPTVRAVRAGDEISVEVEGGFARRRAPADGIVVELAEKDVFVTAEALLEALHALGRLPPASR